MIVNYLISMESETILQKLTQCSNLTITNVPKVGDGRMNGGLLITEIPLIPMVSS